MELKLFTDLIGALGKVVGWRKAIANLPKAERDDAPDPGRTSPDRHHAQNVQNIRLSRDEVAGTSGGAYAAIICVGTNPVTAVIMAGDDANVTITSLANM